MPRPEWRAYSDLAWTESIVASSEDSADEAEWFAKAIQDNSAIEANTLLHIGCGAGAYDFTFKQHFSVTGVDISEGMLEMAEKLNPEVTYIRGDMREIELGERFDAVAIPDSIAYMTMTQDLQLAMKAANKHLKPGGVLLIVANTCENFQENNFVYTGTKGNTSVTMFENNYLYKTNPTNYEATFVYLIRQKDKLETYIDRHILGLFPLSIWMTLLNDEGLKVTQTKLNHLYDRFILGEGEYPLLAFICHKAL